MADYQSIHARRSRERRDQERRERFGLDGAVLFNSFSERDQEAVLSVYQKKFVQGDLKDFGEDKVQAVEHVAKLYLAQKCAFQDVLTKEGFEIASECQKDYDGRIATLSNHGTLTIFGKPNNAGRFITMSRIHSPDLDYDHCRGYLKEDLKLGQNIICSKFISSLLRAIAINPKGSGEPELEAQNAQTLIRRISDETMESFKRPVEELVRDSNYHPLKV